MLHGGENIGDLEDYDGSARIVKEVDIVITRVWCHECDSMIDIGDLKSDDDDDGLICPDCDSVLLEYDEA